MANVRKRDMASTERPLLVLYLTSFRQRLEKTSTDYKLFSSSIRGGGGGGFCDRLAPHST